MREVDGLKQDRSLSYAIGRLPGHLPGCRNCAARDALIADLREEVADRSMGKKEIMQTLKVLEETEAKNAQLTRDVDQWHDKADLKDKQLLEQETSSSAANELRCRLQHELDDALASCKKLSETEEKLSAEQTRVKELQGKKCPSSEISNVKISYTPPQIFFSKMAELCRETLQLLQKLDN